VTLLLMCWAVWVILRRLRRHHWAPYRVEDYTQPAEEAPAYTAAEYVLPPYRPKRDPEPEAEPAPDYFAAAEIERLEALKVEYCAALDAIEREQADLAAEYREASTKRRSTISAKQTTLAGRHAATTRTLANLDAKIERLWTPAHR